MSSVFWISTMPPQSDFVPKSTLGIVPPATRANSTALSADVWLSEKRETDGAEGLWRIHDGIYDLTDFVDKHPGGSDWLSLTKGTDLTEAFEVHHLTSLPEEILKKYFLRNAKKKRNSPFTFKEDGFYRKVKKEIKEVIKTVPKQPKNTSDFITDSLLFFLFLFSTLATRYWSYGLGFFSGMFLTWVTVAAHNYIHRRDNFRMYYFQFSLMQVREFRINHALSHHIHTNTIDDLEISLLEPFLQYLPFQKKPTQRYGSYLMAPLVWIFFFHANFIRRMVDSYKLEGKNLRYTDLISFILPLVIYIFGGQPLLDTLWMWTFITLVGSTYYAFVGLHAGHHHPDVFHDGDVPRSTEDYDWGLSQLDAIIDRKEINGSHFLVLTHFGDHALHHFFPTLDHGVLELIYPTFKEVLRKFDVDIRVTSTLYTAQGSFQQLSKVTPNTSPPDLLKYSKDK